MPGRSPSAVVRLGYEDEVFLRAATALGMPAVGQSAWRFAGVVEVEAVQRLADRLADGPISRVARRPSVPGARARWVPAPPAPPVRVHPEPIAPDAILTWLDATLDHPVDPVAGPPWRLFLAHTTDGRSVLACNVSHAVADGGMRLAALEAAADGKTEPRLPLSDDAARAVGFADDLADAARSLAAAGRAAWALRRRHRPEPMPALQSAERRPLPPPRADDAEPFDAPYVAVDCPTAAWHAAAADGDGTANGLFIAITTEILLEAGIAEAGRPVRVAVPVSTRVSGDARSNATAGVSFPVETERRDGAGRVTDLAHIRARAKQEFSALSAGTRQDPTAHLQPLLQVAPDTLIRRLGRDLTSPLCLASNFGRLSPRVAAPFDDVPCEAVAVRGASLGTTRGALRRARGGITAWWCESDGQCTLGVRAIDPDAVPDRTTLARIVGAVYARWQLPASFW